MSPVPGGPDLPDEDYRRLASFRHALRQFLRFSEQAARAEGLTPNQHQLMLAVRGWSGPDSPTITELADQLQLKVHSTSELVQRAVASGMVEVAVDTDDHRRQHVELTPEGDDKLRSLSVLHRDELRRFRTAGAVMRVPQLAIHLDRDVNEKGLNLNRQEHMAPVLGLASGGHDARGLVHGLCATALGVSSDDIVTTELMLHDRAAPSTGGLDDAFLYSARLDNQAMCHAAITALAGIADAAEAEAGPTPLIALFDHEEVGSDSAYGAASPLLQTTLERIMMNGARDALARALARSFCVSADMAHAVHPNYPDRHEARHRPVLNGGPVIKVNSQQRYATCARTAALFQELCRAEEVPVQHYAHRTDLPCGSTIGPITATRLGIRTVDVGNPMLSMHSAREMAGTKDPELMVRVLRRFLRTPDPFVG